MRRVLKYPGSKWNIALQLVDLIPQHHSYLEPFFGSGAVLFNKVQSNIETVNNIDGDIVNLFKCIQEDAFELARLVMTTPFSREVYENTYMCTESDDKFKKALKFLIRCWQGFGYRTNGKKVFRKMRFVLFMMQKMIKNGKICFKMFVVVLNALYLVQQKNLERELIYKHVLLLYMKLMYPGNHRM